MNTKQIELSNAAGAFYRSNRDKIVKFRVKGAELEGKLVARSVNDMVIDSADGKRHIVKMKDLIV